MVSALLACVAHVLASVAAVLLMSSASDASEPFAFFREDINLQRGRIVFEDIFCPLRILLVLFSDICLDISAYADSQSSHDAFIRRTTDPMLHNEPELYSEFSNDENVETQTDGAQTESEYLPAEDSSPESASSETSSGSKKSTSRDSLSRKRSTSCDSLFRRKSTSRDTPPKKRKGSEATKKKPSARKAPSQAKDKGKNVEDLDSLLNKIRDYMKSANRPFAVGDLVLNFKSEIGRVQMQRALGHLVKDESIYCKVYGKAQIYCVVQSQGDVGDDVISNMDREIEEARADIGRLKGAAEKLANILLAVNEYPSDDVLRSKVRSLEEEIGHCRERLSSVGKDSVNADDIKKVDGDIKKFETEIKRRQNFLRAIVDSLCEGTGMRKKELLCEIGLE